MKLFIAIAATFAVAGGAFAQTAAPAPKPAAKPAPKAAPAKVAAKTEKIVTICALQNEEVKDLKTAEKSTYKGVTYYFCCSGCKPQFDKDPAKYAKAMASKVKVVPVTAPAKKS